MVALFLYPLKDVFGWIYFLAWSATFYPQVFLNYRRGCTVGLSPDFMVMSTTGFIAYALFTFTGYFSTTARAAYTLKRGAPPPIESSDVLFAGHATLMSTLLIMQVLLLPPGLRARRSVSVVCAAIVAVVLLSFSAACVGRLSWVFALELCGSVKVLTSIVKHIPQALANYQRKSTVGWSFTMIWLDIVGGGFSMAQQGVRCIIEQSWNPYTHNLSKLFLAAESLLFDFFFVAQHVLFYPDRTDRDAVYVHLPAEAKEGVDAKM